MSPKTTYPFIVLEGITGSGKTALSQRLAERIGATYYATPPECLKHLRARVDAEASLEERFLFYVSGIMVASEEIRRLLTTGPVVCDKYVLTTICYHTAMGLAVPAPLHLRHISPDFTFLVTCGENVRMDRLRRYRGMKDGDSHHNRQPMERRCLTEFRSCGLVEIDNSTDDPEVAVGAILSFLRR